MGSDFGFPVCTVAARYFWLCEACTRILRLARWTSAGLILEARSQVGVEKACGRRKRMLPDQETLKSGLRTSLDKVA